MKYRDMQLDSLEMKKVFIGDYNSPHACVTALDRSMFVSQFSNSCFFSQVALYTFVSQNVVSSLSMFVSLLGNTTIQFDWALKAK